MSSTRSEQVKEYIKCVKDPMYPIETYMETFDKTREGFVPFKLFPRQKEIIEGYGTNRLNMVLKYRQAGITTITAGYGAAITAFANPKNPDKVLIIANKQETSKEFLAKMVTFIKQLPDWAFDKDKDGDPIYFTKESSTHVRLPNGAEIKAVGTSKDALRGYTPTLIIFDEAAFIEGGAELWAACTASVATGGKITLISTPNGQDQIYYKSYNDSIKGRGKFNIVSIKWWEDPRYRKHLKMVKCEDSVDWILKPDAEKTEEEINIPESVWAEVDAFDPSVIQKYISDGYKPISPWYIEMCRLFNLNKRKIAQELECAFHGSGDNVFSDDIRKKQREENVQDPEMKEKGGTIHIFKPPNPDHKYVAGLDVSRGDSEDHSACVIIDYDTWEQVFEYKGMMPPDLLADFVMEWVRPYNAYLGIDITGGMGVATSRKLNELGYPKKLLYYEHKDPSDPTVRIDETDIAGINFAAKNNRVQIVEAHEEAVRNGFKIRSERWVTEMDTYVYINGKPDHQKGEHDDLIMGGGMAIFLANTAFKRLQKSGDLGKAMARNWKNSANVSNRQGGSVINMRNNPQDMMKQQAQMQTGEVSPFSNASTKIIDNRWLFGVSPKDIELLTIYKNVNGDVDKLFKTTRFKEREVRSRLAKYGIKL